MGPETSGNKEPVLNKPPGALLTTAGTQNDETRQGSEAWFAVSLECSSRHECRIMHNEDLRQARRGLPALLRSCLPSSHGIRMNFGPIVFPLSNLWSATRYPSLKV